MAVLVTLVGCVVEGVACALAAVRAVVVILSGCRYGGRCVGDCILDVLVVVVVWLWLVVDMRVALVGIVSAYAGDGDRGGDCLAVGVMVSVVVVVLG